MSDTSQRSRWAPVVIPALVVGLLAVIAITIVVATDDDDDRTAPTTTASGPTTTEIAPTTSISTTTTTGTTTSTTPITPAPSDLDAAVWPLPAGPERFDDPVELVRRFATEYLRFDAPVIGEFRQGDSRSGEIEIRPRPGGPVTTALARLLGDDGSWYVIGAATANVEVDEPAALAPIPAPLRLRGRARAFEGTVSVEIRADGADVPIATGFVTGRGDGELGLFDSTLAYTDPPAAWGAVLFLTYSAEDGQVWEAAVVRVRFPPT